jgi:hypothetical protein
VFKLIQSFAMETTWQLLSRELKAPEGVMTDSFIMKFDRYMDWNLLSEHYDFSIDMLRIYFHRVVWSKILRKKLFSEAFLREMTISFDPAAWEVLSRYQFLSEQFILDFSNNVDWDYVALYQNVSSKFITDHKPTEEEQEISTSDQ